MPALTDYPFEDGLSDDQKELVRGVLSGVLGGVKKLERELASLRHNYLKAESDRDEAFHVMEAMRERGDDYEALVGLVFDVDRGLLTIEELVVCLRRDHEET